MAMLGRTRTRTALCPLALVAVGALISCSSGSTGPGAPTSGTPTVAEPSAVPSQTAGRPGPAERLDLPYVDDGNPAHRLDLFLPPDATTAPPPLAIFIHGGGWQRGDKAVLSEARDQGLPQYKAMLLAHGYAVASINYRLSGEATFPANIQDVKAAVRYLRADAARLGVDPGRFAAIGESAGAHLALLLGTSSGDTALEGDLGTPGVSSAVQAVVSYYGFGDLRVRTRQLAEQGCPSTGRDVTSEGLMLGAEPDSESGAALAAQASPITHIDPADPPTLLFHGTKDCTAPTAQSKDMAAALTAAGVTAELKLIDADHAEAAFYLTPELQQQVVRFLAAHLPRS